MMDCVLGVIKRWGREGFKKKQSSIIKFCPLNRFTSGCPSKTVAKYTWLGQAQYTSYKVFLFLLSWQWKIKSDLFIDNAMLGCINQATPWCNTNQSNSVTIVRAQAWNGMLSAFTVLFHFISTRTLPSKCQCYALFTNEELRPQILINLLGQHS